MQRNTVWEDGWVELRLVRVYTHFWTLEEGMYQMQPFGIVMTMFPITCVRWTECNARITGHEDASCAACVPRPTTVYVQMGWPATFHLDERIPRSLYQPTMQPPSVLNAVPVLGQVRLAALVSRVTFSNFRRYSVEATKTKTTDFERNFLKKRTVRILTLQVEKTKD